MTRNIIREAEIEWYLKNGKYPNERIKTDSADNKYVEGDFTWNKKNPDKHEVFEPMMSMDN